MKSLHMVSGNAKRVQVELRKLLLMVVVMLATHTEVTAQTYSHTNDLTLTLRIKNHMFVPAQLVVPANTRFRLLIVNEDKTAEEFESASLNREKVIMGESEAIIFLGPLAAGEYGFFGEFNPRTANGKLIVVSP